MKGGRERGRGWGERRRGGGEESRVGGWQTWADGAEGAYWERTGSEVTQAIDRKPGLSLGFGSEQSSARTE